MVALVITIIVLMILAGVGLSFVLGDNGILKKAQESADAYKDASQSEQQTLQNIENYLYGEKGGTGDNTTGGGNIPTELKVGSTVSYAPTGTYNWQAQYYASVDSIKNHGENYTFSDITLDSSTDDYKIGTWKVFEIDKTNKKVTLVSGNTNGVVGLQGAQGYNNGVKLLNDACSNLYSMPSKGITARSMNLEDVEKKMTATALASARGDNYPKQVSSANSKDQSYYPSIYAQEKLSVIDGIKRSTGLGMSEQKTLIGRTDSGATNGYLQANVSIQPYNTAWSLTEFGGKISSLKSSFQTDAASGVSYFDLIYFCDGLSDTRYGLLASREVDVQNSFSIGCVGGEAFQGVQFSPLYRYDNNMEETVIAAETAIGCLFPIVTVPADLIVSDGENFKVK